VKREIRGEPSISWNNGSKLMRKTITHKLDGKHDAKIQISGLVQAFPRMARPKVCTLCLIHRWLIWPKKHSARLSHEAEVGVKCTRYLEHYPSDSGHSECRWRV
jgi:hypothetical protein